MSGGWQPPSIRMHLAIHPSASGPSLPPGCDSVREEIDVDHHAIPVAMHHGGPTRGGKIDAVG